MADKMFRKAENVPGRFYVDETCAPDCSLCCQIAPSNFTKKSFAEADWETAYVYKQPNVVSEENDCREAMEKCPARCIGNDE